MTADVSRLPLFGVNLPWIDGAYGHDLAPSARNPTWPCDFDAMRSYAPLIRANDLGFRAVRIWLCENGEGIVCEDGKPAAVHERLLESVTVMQECARMLGMGIYWTLLDGNSWKRENDDLTHAILSDEDHCARFAEKVAAPLARKMDPDVTFAVEIVNEPEALSPNCVKEDPVAWNVLGRSIRTIGDAVRGVRAKTMVTSGTGHVYLRELVRAETGVGAYDVHVYHVTGGIPSREELAERSGDARIATRAIPLILGEGGVFEGGTDDPTIPNYLFNARLLGYDAAFIWQLDKLLLEKDGAFTPLGRTVRTTLEDIATGRR
ncbi:MAG TPA: hypothetical protein VH054_19175 [Polyangiaceae bacterium]|nr:hypothetical protein [Polyangiaceae bacterium]